MKTIEIESYGFSRYFVRVTLLSNIEESNLNLIGDKCLVINYLPSIEEFRSIISRFDDTIKLILLPQFSSYSHFMASIWNSECPVVCLKAPNIFFSGGEVLLVDLEQENMQIAESEEDIETLSTSFANFIESSSRRTKPKYSSAIEILGEATSLNEINYTHAVGGAGIGVLKSELFYKEKQLDLKKIQEIKSYIQNSNKVKPLLIRFFDIESLSQISKNWNQPTKYLGYRGVRLLEVEEIWLDRFIQLIDSFDTSNLIPIIPMVTSSKEVEKFHTALPNKYKSIGVTIETPAAALSIDKILEISSFIEIGLNDLTQYTMAWDRDVPNPERLPTSHFTHPVELLIKQLVDKCNASNVEYALGLDLKPSKKLASKLKQLDVKKISCSPNLILHWLEALDTSL